jgi:predicted phage tail protein
MTEVVDVAVPSNYPAEERQYVDTGRWEGTAR